MKIPGFFNPYPNGQGKPQTREQYIETIQSWTEWDGPALDDNLRHAAEKEGDVLDNLYRLAYLDSLSETLEALLSGSFDRDKFIPVVFDNWQGKPLEALYDNATPELADILNELHTAYKEGECEADFGGEDLCELVHKPAPCIPSLSAYNLGSIRYSCVETVHTVAEAAVGKTLTSIWESRLPKDLHDQLYQYPTIIARSAEEAAAQFRALLRSQITQMSLIKFHLEDWHFTLHHRPINDGLIQFNKFATVMTDATQPKLFCVGEDDNG